MRFHVWFIWMAAVAWGVVVAQPAAEQVELRIPPGAPVQPPLPRPAAVGFFKELLSMSPAERDRALAEKPDSKRKVLLEKLSEYERMPSEQRDHRLQLLEVWEILVPLMKTSPENRAPLLERIPEPHRKLIEQRLREWDLLPPEIQQEEWRKDFIRFFQLPQNQRVKTLEVLPDEERLQMEKVLERFRELPRDYQQMCIDSFSKLANMSSEDRAQFLKNAERWSAMTPQERQNWRNFISLLPRPTPPMPDGTGAQRSPPMGSNPKSPPAMPGFGKN